MVEIWVRSGEVHCTGLIPGQDVELRIEDVTWVIHRHGNECHAHKIEQEKGE